MRQQQCRGSIYGNPSNKWQPIECLSFAQDDQVWTVTDNDSTLPQLVSLLLLSYELRHAKDRGAQVLQPKRH